MTTALSRHSTMVSNAADAARLAVIRCTCNIEDRVDSHIGDITDIHFRDFADAASFRTRQSLFHA